MVSKRESKRKTLNQDQDDSSIIIRCKDRDEWLKKREGHIGASDASTVLGLNPYKSRLELFNELTGRQPVPDLSGVEAVEWGHIMEPVIADRYAARTGRVLYDPGRFTIRRSKKWAFMQATLDRVIVPIEVNDPVGSLEIKTTGSQFASQWEDDVPVGPQSQLQQQLAVAGFTWGSIVVLIGGQAMRYKDFPRNDEFIAYLVEVEEEFLDMVRRDDPPDPDATISAREALRILYPKETGATIELPVEAMEWAVRRRRAKEAIAAAELELLEVENYIKAAMKDAAIGILPDGAAFTYKTTNKSEYTVPATSFRVLRERKAR